MKHEIKVWPRYFKVAWAGDKNFEIRLNDRNYEQHDEIILQEYILKSGSDGEPSAGEYTGREIHGFITYVTEFEQKKGFVVFAYREAHRVDG